VQALLAKVTSDFEEAASIAAAEHKKAVEKLQAERMVCQET
jgi:hypothetical protein